MTDNLLEMRKVEKSYPGVKALDDVNFTLEQGEVHCLVGENGAGKSTLMKILAGAEKMDSGSILFEKTQEDILSTKDAFRLGINIIYQEFNLVSHLDVAENIFLGKEPSKGPLGFINKTKMYKNAKKITTGLGMELPLQKKIFQLSIAEKQMVEICKAVATESKILIMDEPSAALTRRELDHLFALIHRLKKDKVSIIYISHRLEEIFEIGDRVTVLRDGKNIKTDKIKNLNRHEIVRLMVGRDLTEEFPVRYSEITESILEVKQINIKGMLKNISFILHKGEILGISGLVGAGRTELARAVFGDLESDSGTVILDGMDISKKKVRERIKAGIGFVTEDRKTLGLLIEKSLKENMTLASLDSFTKTGFINKTKETAIVKEYIKSLKIKYSSIDQYVKTLSGGNQQKVVLAKWLITNSKVLIFDEPTRGIDVGAKKEIYDLMNSLTSKGLGIIMISSELPEILGMCDRILVMREGEITGQLSGKDATQEKIMLFSTNTKN